MGINTRIFKRANYLRSDMSILVILNSGLGFQVHYDWRNVKGIVRS
jgi:hypothetical protein